MFYNFKKNKKAFTLVELIVVIAIIAILGAVVGVTVGTFVDRARKTAATSPLTSLADNWENNKLASGSDIKTLSGFIADLFPQDTASFGISNTNNWAKKPSEMPSGTFYVYFHNSDCGKYYGRLKITGGAFDKKQVTALTEAPSDWNDYA